MNDLSLQIRNLQRELDALKRGMFGGAKSYYNSQLSVRTFTGVSGAKTITTTFARKDFPVLSFIVTDQASGVVLEDLVHRIGRYQWHSQGSTLQPPVNITCYCLAEQIPTWSIA